MSHVKRFQSIPMSKSMRGLCKEEDYAFLETSGSSTEGYTEDKVALEDDWKDKKEACRHLEWEHQEKERLRGIEESKKEKEQQWRTHIAEVTSNQKKTLQDRLTRLHRFREFQRRILAEEEEMEGVAVDQLFPGITGHQD
ncbi:U2 small nuclear ribonucleoprotein auxiliary factor 35 kDa subunit-related protein 1-like isoform X2 [Girardinichthys multiradiatus]|uniref:U2 small nuclear ribonucleoprotein auxiliary factor 35 kDa subunit-related protein 1-like isoform X2 n=1 Tax=Girardinichthys multiradiatus TaxID=208333 RepID=UPI001FAD1882|nr:U2 small nuclear ribonucleoprotein auxiliary factor 35 kDa subunit-related protein 1-like isoform X2 [Girardinichthys multiradiatus]